MFLNEVKCFSQIQQTQKDFSKVKINTESIHVESNKKLYFRIKCFEKFSKQINNNDF